MAVAGFDHAVIGVRDLEAARAAWRRLGFVVTPRGRHVGWGTANYCMMFGATYTELLGIVEPAEPVNGLDTRLVTAGEGLLSLALATKDADAAHRDWLAAGLALTPPESLSRELKLSDGAVMPRFRLLHLPKETIPGLGLFLTQHLTPDLIRQPDWLTHPNGALDLQSVTVLADDPPALLPVCTKLFGVGACNLTDATLTLILRAQALVVMRPDDAEAIFDDATALLSFRSADVARARFVLDANGIGYRTGGDGSLQVTAADANGVAVEFTDKDL
jgi:catechol 2,3-dioxygenase-like lactoylglutathione lyase family enzyme